MKIMKNGKWKLKCFSLEKKPAPAIFKTLTVQASEAILELDPDTLPVDGGAENLIKVLDNLYLKNRNYLV